MHSCPCTQQDLDVSYVATEKVMCAVNTTSFVENNTYLLHGAESFLRS